MAEQTDAPKLIAITAYASDISRLLEHGYREVGGVPSQPGEFCVVGSDVAPGWAEYWYDLDVYELPEQPLGQLGWHV